MPALVVGMVVLCHVDASIAAGRSERTGRAPQRVVSMNICTDQMAMLLAGEGQLISVSTLAHDPRSSAMAAEAMTYPTNLGQAEEIYLLNPDLVLAGRYTAQASTRMLERLGVPVVVFDPSASLADVRANLSRMGQLLGQEARAEQLLADFDTRLAALRALGGTRPRAVLFGANGYTSGQETLADEILEAAGFDNIAAEIGFARGGNIPLEVLAMAQPDVVITGRPWPGASRAEEIMRHPVARAFQQAEASQSGDWSCETPYILDAIEELSELRREIAGAGQ